MYNTPIQTLKWLQQFIAGNADYFKHHVVTAFAFYKRNEAELWRAIQHFGGIKYFNKVYRLKLIMERPAWTEQQLISELWKIHAQGDKISVQGLKAIGRTDLLTIARRHSSLGDIKIKMGLGRKRNKWTKEKVIKEYKKLYRRWRKIPSSTALKKKGYLPLDQAIRKYFKTYKNLRSRLNMPVSRKEMKYWTRRRTMRDLRAFCRTHKLLIENSSLFAVLRAQRNSGLINAINNHGGIKMLNKKMKLGLVLHGEMWNEEKVMKILKRLHQEGHTLNEATIMTHGGHRLKGAVYKFGTLNYFRKKLGLPEIRRNYWNEATIIKELKPITDYYRFIPSGCILRALGRNDLARAISKHGGWNYFSQLLGISLRSMLKAQDGHYLQSSYECIFDNILYRYKVPHRVHVQISNHSRHRCDFLIGKTYIEITGFDRKGDNTYSRNLQTKIKLYNKLGKNFLLIPQATFLQRIAFIERDVLDIIKNISYNRKKTLVDKGDVCIKPGIYWADFENIKNELSPLTNKYGCMPGSKVFYKEKKSGLLAAMYKYHGSPFEVANLLNLPIKHRAKGYYTKTRVIAEYKALCVAHKKYLSQRELQALNKSALAYAMYNYGGATEIRKACNLGFPLRNLSRIPRYNQQKAILEYKKLCKKYKRFLTQQDLKDEGFKTLERYIRSSKMGIYFVQKKTELQYLPNHVQKGTHSVPKAIELYKKLCVKHGYFLTQREAKKKMDNRLLQYIDRGIGFIERRKLTKLTFTLNRKVRKDKGTHCSRSKLAS